MISLGAWIKQQSISDTGELRGLANDPPIESTTPQADLQVPREAYSHEVVIRDIVQARYGPLADYAGLSKKARFDLLRSRLDDAYDNGATQADKNQALYDASTIKSVNDMAKEEGGGMSHADFLKATDAVPQPDVIVYGDSPADANGWGYVSSDAIEAAMRGE